MKIIEGLKKLKELKIKADDLAVRIRNHCADLSHETPRYTDQAAQVQSWIDARRDIVKEILRLRIAIQRTNLLVRVVVETEDGVSVEKTIAEWIHRRKDLAAMEMESYAVLTDRGLKGGNLPRASGVPLEVKIRRYFSQQHRDERYSALKAEPLRIDSALEVANAINDLVE